ncbi:unnamed protein product [Gulo gulo]|uniref:Uncharacterized protein n=1 Tax=Gulo gulo TaxID=48420 RepID=A0A9X9Q7H7_GULGU|nr:unnamed protein product [Gulo gulo]
MGTSLPKGEEDAETRKSSQGDGDRHRAPPLTELSVQAGIQLEQVGGRASGRRGPEERRHGFVPGDLVGNGSHQKHWMQLVRWHWGDVCLQPQRALESRAEKRGFYPVDREPANYSLTQPTPYLYSL